MCCQHPGCRIKRYHGSSSASECRRLLRLYSLMRLLAVSWSCISRPKVDQRHNSTASTLCCVCSRFFRENETESRLPFSENLTLKVGRCRKIAIGSEQWTCMLSIRLLDKVNEVVFSYISTLKLWGKIHISH